MKTFIDITGQVFGFFTAVRYVPNYRPGSRWWLVRCTCDKELHVSYSSLVSGHSTKCRSCATKLQNPALKHGAAKSGQVSPEHKAWTEMLNRCLNPNNAAFARYGGRGIKVWPKWTERTTGFIAFLEHIGVRPAGHSLDRINNDDDYEPGNVRWASREQQNRNKRNNINVSVANKTQTVAEWGRERGLPEYLIYRRLADGWSPEEAVLKPLGYRRKKRDGPEGS